MNKEEVLTAPWHLHRASADNPQDPQDLLGRQSGGVENHQHYKNHVPGNQEAKCIWALPFKKCLKLLVGDMQVLTSLCELLKECHHSMLPALCLVLRQKIEIAQWNL